MKKIDKFELIHIIITLGIIFILLGTTLELEKVIEDSENKQELIERQADELIKCKNGEYYE